MNQDYNKSMSGYEKLNQDDEEYDNWYLKKRIRLLWKKKNRKSNKKSKNITKVIKNQSNERSYQRTSSSFLMSLRS